MIGKMEMKKGLKSVVIELMGKMPGNPVISQAIKL
jgi:hypothetical protein